MELEYLQGREGQNGMSEESGPPREIHCFGCNGIVSSETARIVENRWDDGRIRVFHEPCRTSFYTGQTTLLTAQGKAMDEAPA